MRGVQPHPLGVLQKNSWSTNFENSEDSRQHDYYYYQFYLAASSHEIFLRVGAREGMKGLGALQRHQLPHPLAKILDPPLTDCVSIDACDARCFAFVLSDNYEPCSNIGHNVRRGYSISHYGHYRRRKLRHYWSVSLHFSSIFSSSLMCVH